jgi:hypothetical protein
MAFRFLAPCCLLATVACSHAPGPDVRTEPGQADTLQTMGNIALDTLPIDTAVRSHAPDPLPASPPHRADRTEHPRPDEGCVEYMNYRDGITTITTYIPKKDLAAHEQKIAEMLPNAYLLAEQSAPRSIACDFEHGTSHEHIDMPIPLPVSIRIYERCSARSPHTELHFVVRRDDQGGFAHEAR